MKWLFLFALFMLVGCQSAPNLPTGPSAYASFPPPGATETLQDYEIGPFDALNITVFQEPDLSLEEAQVDASGNLIFPLIGAVTAAGRTGAELAKEIADRLEAKYLVDPQVSVIVASSVSQRVIVEGAVAQPGVYPITGRTTLLEAMAMAKGPNEIAALNEIVIFRDLDGQRQAAMFNLNHIRRGEAPDPQVLGNDTIVVGMSNVKALWRDTLRTLPIFGVFRTLNSAGAF